MIIGLEAPVLVTGARGFVGSRTVAALLKRGFSDIRCLVRDSSDLKGLGDVVESAISSGKVKLLAGNLLSRQDCTRAASGVELVYHLAAGTGQKSFPDAFMNSVVTTRNLLDACIEAKSLKRLVSISSFTVYSNRNNPKGRLLDESAPVEESPHLRGEAYCFAKQRQDRLIEEYGARHGVRYVLLRPGVVYGPAKPGISGRVGRELGVFLHFGGSNKLPLTYVDNCAEAIVLAGLVPGIDGEVFNVVDDDLPTSRGFLREYKRNVRSFRSIYLPKPASYLLCLLWEKYSAWSQGQLPPVFNRLSWHAYWKGSDYTNEKMKSRLGWRQVVPTSEALAEFFQCCRRKETQAHA